MKLAPIAPVDLLYTLERSNYQLMLPQLLRKERYAAFYAELCRDPEQYVILDNGAAEDEPFDFEALAVICQTMKPDELVLPDVYGDAAATLQLAVECFDWFAESDEWEQMSSVKLGVVLTGKSPAQAFELLEQLYDRGYVLDVVYMPRLLVQPNRLDARIDLAHRVQDLHSVMRREVPIHFLGTSPLWAAEIRTAAKYVPFVRGVDTSMPFNYAWGRVDLKHDPRKQVSRPEYYFDLTFDDEQLALASLNLHTMQHWAAGRD